MGNNSSRTSSRPSIAAFKANIIPQTSNGIENMRDEGISINNQNGRDSLQAGAFLRNRKELNSMRSSKHSPKSAQEMPDSEELEKRFTKVLASMDLPADKAKLLKQYDNDRKWEIICDQELVQVKNPPKFYLRKLKTYMDLKASRSLKKRKTVNDTTSTQVLKDLEISLRTNNIEWVQDFLDEENNGLDVLVEYLSFRISMLSIYKPTTIANEDKRRPKETIGPLPKNDNVSKDILVKTENGVVSLSPSAADDCSDGTTISKRTSRHIVKLNMGNANNDIHVCILCLRAIMNTKQGLNMVIQKQAYINVIALSFKHRSLRTKALVLELLAAICLVQGGHQIILKAFDNFKIAMNENLRWQTLVDSFMFVEQFNVEFMVACMQFINIIVHSVDDLHERIYLQHAFDKMGVEKYLDRIKNTESEEFRLQISAYLENKIDVGALMEDSETKNAALEQVSELEDEVSQLREIYQKLEIDSLSRMVELENRIKEYMEERENLLSVQQEIDEEVKTLRRVVDQKDEEMKTIRRSRDMENYGKSNGQMSNSNSNNSVSSNNPAVVPPPPPAPPVSLAPPPPPPPMMMNSNSGPNSGLMAPPPPPPFGGKSQMTIKKALQPKCKLPTLNWTVLKPREVKGTVFNQLDDSKYYSIIDFERFESVFKIGLSPSGDSNSSDQNDGEGIHNNFSSKRFKKPENVSVLEHTRLRNLAISRRKLDMSIEVVVKTVNLLDINSVNIEQIEVLQRMVPNELETKLYKEYIAARKNPELLTDEDKFLLQLTRVERISSKLSVMAYLKNFEETITILQPQVHAIIMASRSIQTSEKFHKVLEIILALGNYLNGAKRGPAYGYKIQSLECLTEMKSLDKMQSLMHFVVETIETRVPNLKGFLKDLQFVEKATQVSLENILCDLQDLEKGMELTKKEAEFLKQRNESNTVIVSFLLHAEEKLTRLRNDCKVASKNFGDCVEFYGEERQQTDSITFFTAILKFSRGYHHAENEIEQKRQLMHKSQSPPATINKVNGKKQQEAVINELKRKQGGVPDNKIHQISHGVLEEILSDLKQEPYRRADAQRRSQRRKTDRLSRNLDDIGML